MKNVLFAVTSVCSLLYAGFALSFVDDTQGEVDEILNKSPITIKTEGSSCAREDGGIGTCKKLPECPAILREVKKGLRDASSKNRCGFENFTEIVCCPTNKILDKIGAARASEAMCHENKESAASKLKLVYHIFGGQRAFFNEFPYMAALGYSVRNEDVDNEEWDNSTIIRYNCGGTLISPRYVLTAAHCVVNLDNRVPVEVRMGSENLTVDSESVQKIPVKNVIPYPEYKISVNYNDIALLELEFDVRLTGQVKPICLQTKSFAKENVSLIVIGWGATSFESLGSPYLMKTPPLSLVEIENCTKSYTQFRRKLPRGLDEERMLCLVDSDTQRKADGCQGDSGGPLLIFEARNAKLLGITSFGRSCGTSVPAVYTSVIPYLNWIESHVWPETEDNDLKVDHTQPDTKFYQFA